MKGLSFLPSGVTWEGWKGKGQYHHLFAGVNLRWGRYFWCGGAMADVAQACEARGCSKVTGSGRTDADFIWMRVSVQYLQPLNSVDFLKKIKKMLSWLVLAIMGVLRPRDYYLVQSTTLETIMKKPYSNIFSSLAKFTFPPIYQL